MNEITITTWETILHNRDNTIAHLFIIVAVLLLCWRVWVTGLRAVERVVPGLGAVAFIGLLALGVVELWTN
jgi:hypothetical protein